MYKSDFEFPTFEHEHFFYEALLDLGAYTQTTEEIVFLLGLSLETRRHFWEIFSYQKCTIVDTCKKAPWQTPETRRLIAMAVKLAYTQD